MKFVIILEIITNETKNDVRKNAFLIIKRKKKLKQKMKE